MIYCMHWTEVYYNNVKCKEKCEINIAAYSASSEFKKSNLF